MYPLLLLIAAILAVIAACAAFLGYGAGLDRTTADHDDIDVIWTKEN